MVLCSHVYLLLRYDLPPLTLQPTEIDSAHWVSIRVLGSSSLRTVERCDVFERLSLQANWVTRGFLRTFFGQMLFGATQLLPTESIYCNPMSGRFPDPIMWTNRESFLFWRMMGSRILKRSGPGILRPPLLLWGLTYGIVADFLGPLYPKEASKFWKWPTFSYWDFRFAAWVCSINFRRRKMKELIWRNDKLLSEKLYNQGEIGAHSFSIDTVTREGQSRVMSSSIVDIMLDGYLDRLRKAIIISVIIRVVLMGILTYLLTGSI